MIEGLPQYRCHKVVGAIKILSLSVRKAEDSVRFTCEGGRVIEVVYERYAAMQPEEGWYLVQYGDHYISFSPPVPFETGYTLIEEPALA